MKTIKYLFLLAISIVLISACQKNNSPITADELDLADDESVMEAIFDDVFSSADNAVQMLDGFTSGKDTKGDVVTLADSCPLITVDLSDELVKTITIDYGNGCQGFFELVRSGKIIIEATGPRRVVGSTRTLTFENYLINGIKVEGTRFVENMGPNDNENVVFMSSLSDGKLIFPDDTVVEREFTRYREFIAGYYTRHIWDDECLVTGIASGNTYSGISYENSITTALHWKRVCHFFVSGVIEIKKEEAEPFELDYGEGECDALATIRRGDEEKEITLKWKHRKLR